jgi:SAM-dependent methyltransferase
VTTPGRGARLARSAGVEPEWVKEAQRQLYSAGEYWALSRVLAPAAAATVEAAGVGHGSRVLDVAAGDGNAALAAAARGADVVAVDLSPDQVERGRARTTAAGHDVDWVVGDAEALPFEDGIFTHVVSVFGLVFAPRPEVAVRELFRVCASDGTAALTAWPDGGLMAEATAAVRVRATPGDPFPDLELGWGAAARVRERLAPYAAHVEVEERALLFEPAVRGAAGAADCGAAYLAEHLPAEELATLQEERARIAARHAGPAGIPEARYLLAVARRG